jgi:hypothetical protein
MGTKAHTGRKERRWAPYTCNQRVESSVFVSCVVRRFCFGRFLPSLRLGSAWRVGIYRSLSSFSQILQLHSHRHSNTSSSTSPRIASGIYARSGRQQWGEVGWGIALTSLHRERRVVKQASSQRLLSQILLNHLRYHTTTHPSFLCFRKFCCALRPRSGCIVYLLCRVHDLQWIRQPSLR